MENEREESGGIERVEKEKEEGGRMKRRRRSGLGGDIGHVGREVFETNVEGCDDEWWMAEKDGEIAYDDWSGQELDT